MIGPLARPLALFTVLAALSLCAAPQPAAAFNPVKPVCTVIGLFSGLVGKLCTAADHGKQLLAAGNKLLGGHLGGALKALSGSSTGKALTAAATLGAVGAWVVGGARFALSETSAIVSTTTRPQLQSTWFSSFYWRMAGISALLTLPFLFAAAIQALVRSDLALLLRSAFGYLPLGMLAVAIAAPLTMLLLAASDELSKIVSGAAGNGDTAFLAKAGGAGALSLLAHSPFIAFFVGLLTAGAALVLWSELLIRSAAVYVIVLMLPLFFAAMVWPARRVWAVRAVEVLVALILSKFAIVAVLALGGAAIGHAGILSITQMLAGATLILLAAFSPWALLRMLPLHELAAGAVGGLRSQAQGPLDLGPAEGATELAQDRSPRLLPPGQAGDDAPARTVVERLGAQRGNETRAADDPAHDPADDRLHDPAGDPPQDADQAAGSMSPPDDPPAARPGTPSERDETLERALSQIVKPGAVTHLDARGESLDPPPIEPPATTEPAAAAEPPPPAELSPATEPPPVSPPTEPPPMSPPGPEPPAADTPL